MCRTDRKGQSPKVLGAVPISLGARSVQVVIQKCAVENRCRQRVVVFQKRCEFRLDMPIPAIPAVWMRNEQLRSELQLRPVGKEV